MEPSEVVNKDEPPEIETKISFIYTKDSGQCGTGIFTREAINAGEMVLKIDGQFFDINTCPDFSHALQVDQNKWVLNPEAIWIFTNHTCDPKIGLVQINGETYLKAIQALEKDEEIKFDYSTSMSGEPWGLDQCFCGSQNCRGRIQNYKDIPQEFKTRYEALGIVPKHVIENQ